MRKFIPILQIIIILASGFPAAAQAGAEEKLLQDAKLLVIDGQWSQALEKLDELLKRNPSGSLAAQACFYRAKCLNKLPGRERDALEAFKVYLQQKDRNQNLADEAESTVIELALKLFEKGERSHLKEVEDRLTSANTAIRFYAAYQLSFVKDKAIASKAVPVLKDFSTGERDNELRDRARIALLRVDPNALKDVEMSKPERGGAKILVIEITKAGMKKPEVLIKIPWALADLALGSISQSQKELLRRRGYDIDSISNQLLNIKGNIIEISDGDETVKIYIDRIK